MSPLAQYLELVACAFAWILAAVAIGHALGQLIGT